MPIYRAFNDDFEWPQDDLSVPQLGPMPPVEAGNRNVIGREYTTYVARFQLAANYTQYLTPTPVFVPIDQSADFWCDHITTLSYAATGAAQAVVEMPAVMVRIQDARTGADMGFQQTYPSPSPTPPNNTPPLTPNLMPLALFGCMPNSGIEAQLAYTGAAPLPDGFRTAGTLIQPFLFTRQGGIQITLVNIFGTVGANTSQDISLVFSGWKEYEYASH